MLMKANPANKAFPELPVAGVDALHVALAVFNVNDAEQFKHTVADEQLAQFDGHAVQFAADDAYPAEHKTHADVPLCKAQFVIAVPVKHVALAAIYKPVPHDHDVHAAPAAQAVVVAAPAAATVNPAEAVIHKVPAALYEAHPAITAAQTAEDPVPTKMYVVAVQY